uniref:Guanine nucleotide-binding protein subunit gamma n=1 Tax=Astatotilapia calliptera TaxID=8154 RepID=A0A3P8NG21_ASTCA
MTTVFFEYTSTFNLGEWSLNSLLKYISTTLFYEDFFSPKTIINNMTSNSNLSNMRRLVEQLKLEASVERIKVSQAAAELQQYCLQNAGKDALLVGVPTGSNPFREPRSCAIV